MRQNAKNAEIPAIYDESYVAEYDVLPKEADDSDENDSVKCELRNAETGNYLLDYAVSTIVNHSNIGDAEKLIGKKIRVTTKVEVIE